MVLARKIRSPGRFSTLPQNAVTDFFDFFSSSFQQLTPADPFYPPNPSLILVRGLEAGISEG